MMCTNEPSGKVYCIPDEVVGTLGKPAPWESALEGRLCWGLVGECPPRCEGPAAYPGNQTFCWKLETGLVGRTGSDELGAADAVCRELLSQQPKRQPTTGVDRFLRLGRIERYPVNSAERPELLAWIVGEAIQPGEDLTERQVNERLLSYIGDGVLLRRCPGRLRPAARDDVGVLIRTDSNRAHHSGRAICSL